METLYNTSFFSLDLKSKSPSSCTVVRIVSSFVTKTVGVYYFGSPIANLCRPIDENNQIIWTEFTSNKMVNTYKKKDPIPVGCSTDCSLSNGGGSPWTETPTLDKRPHSWTETPILDRDPTLAQRPHSWTETPLLDRDPTPGQRPHSWTETSLDRDTPPTGQRSPL